MTEIDWILINPGKAWLGDNRGALMHAANGPRHEIRIEQEFEISASPITFAQWTALTGQPAAGDTSENPLNRLTPLMIEAGLLGAALRNGPLASFSSIGLTFCVLPILIFLIQ